MKLRLARSRRLGLLVYAVALGACGGDDSTETVPVDLGSVDGIMTSLPLSCAFDCSGCNEPTVPYSCPTVKAWTELPHDSACGTWDGTYPSPTQGKCSASEPTGEAARKTGPFTGGLVLPDGHRITPAGREVVFDEPDLLGGFPMSILPIPGTRFALASDGGIKDNALRVIGLDSLASGGAAVASYVPFPDPSAMFYGLAWLPPTRAYASGGGDGFIHAFDVDPTAGLVTAVASKDITVGAPMSWYSGPIAATADGTRLLVAPSEYVSEVRVMSLADADYGTQLAAIPLDNSHNIFDLRLDPFDPSGTTFYATDQTVQGARLGRLLEIDASKNTVSRTVELDKAPSQLLFLDATYVIVAEADSDKLAVVDRTTGTVVDRVAVFDASAPHGFSPTSMAYDATTKRLYAALASANAVEAYDVAGTPPTISSRGRIPTAWWPTAVMLDADGSLVVLNGKGHGTGTDDKQYPWGSGPITGMMHGSVQYVPASMLATLDPLTAAVDANRKLADVTGRSQVTCPAGADDFPIPTDDKSGPSKQIKHVILVVRENKTFDAVFGDRSDLGDGDAKLIMAPDADLQERVWKNARSIAKAFTNFDNFYTDAEQSIQGHTWTVYGRTTDTMERSWLSVWGRATRPVTTPVTDEDMPEEGGIFTWLERENVDYDDMGEIVGKGATDPHYPGLIYAQNVPDIDKSCYIGGRIRLRCDLKPFTYAVQANDHTYGGQEGAAAPEVMIAVNDEAIGLLLDALSHSPTWQDTLLIVTEDDPQDGGDHVDLHRSVLFMASPWVRRGYVSHGHYDMSSVYKLVAHVLGISYNNDLIGEALLPYDAFTSTPDYTPYTYVPRTVTAPCNPASMESKAAENWDFDKLDNQPGLSQQIADMLKKGRKERGVRVVEPRR